MLLNTPCQWIAVSVTQQTFNILVDIIDQQIEHGDVTHLQGFDNVQIGHSVELGVLGGMEILLCHHHTLSEEVLIDGDSVLLWHQHPGEPVENKVRLSDVNNQIIAT